MKKIITLFLLILTYNSLMGQYDPKALEILESMSKKYKVMTAFEANFSYTWTNKIDDIHEEFKGKIVVKGDKYRLLLPEQEISNDGTTVWTYLPEAMEVNIDNSDKTSDDYNPYKFYDIYKKGFKYLYLEDKLVDKILCEVVDLVPEKKDAQFYKIRMLIAKKDKSVQSWIMFDRSGNEYSYKITKFNPSVKVDNNYFVFNTKLYPNVEVIDLR